MGGLYDTEYFRWQRTTAARSAEALLPIVIELFSPESIVDIGCGTGMWLRGALDLGVEDVFGVDDAGGDELVIPPDRFLRHDLREPIRLDRQFDLAICMEVVEHLPPARGPELVRELCALADVVLFSGAIPGQTPPGTPKHPNERWQSYWAAEFVAAGHQPVDALRARIWNDGRIAFWYRQNLFVAVAAATPAPHGDNEIRDLVHPDLWKRVHTDLWAEEISLRAHLHSLPGAFRRALERRL